jgi:hypothetical protein
MLIPSDEDSGHFRESFQAIMCEYCDYGYDEVLDERQVNQLKNYFTANHLLLECLDVAYVSNRQAIEDSLLLPPGMWDPEDFAR